MFMNLARSRAARGWIPMAFGIAGAGFLTLWLAGSIGCAKRPEFSHEIQLEVSKERYPTIALDPRTDIIFGDGSQMCLDASHYQLQVIQELEAMGYRVVPSNQAKLWVQVLALTARPPRMDRNAMNQAPAEGMRGRGMSSGPGGGKGGFGGGPGGGPGGEPRGGQGSAPQEARKKGNAMITLVVALLEPSTGEALWRATLKTKPSPFGPRPSDKAPGGSPSGPREVPPPQDHDSHEDLNTGPQGNVHRRNADQDGDRHGKREDHPNDFEDMNAQLRRMLEPLRTPASATK